MCLENMVRTCLIYGMGKSSSEPLKLLIGSFPGRTVGKVVIFLHDGKLGKKPAGVAAGVGADKNKMKRPPLRAASASSKFSPTV